MKAPPEDFLVIRGPGVVAWARPEARAWVEASLRAGLTLHRAAAGAAGGGEALPGGRGPAYVVRSRAGAWVVRHAFRGGAAARLLGDRYVRFGTPRPFREIHVSEEARDRGVATPRVVAAATYPAGVFYRGDVVTELVPGARSLGGLLFGPDRATDPALRAKLLEEAARVPARLAEVGLRHRDLNVDNLLVPEGTDGRELVLLDLDRCRTRAGPLPDGGAGMSDRLGRSLRRAEERRGPPLGRGEWEVFGAAASRRGSEGLSRSRPGEAPSSPPGDEGKGSPPRGPGT